METMNIQTIDVQAKEYNDKKYGNTYFSAIVTLNFGKEDEKTFKFPFQYGYDDQYLYEAFLLLEKKGLLSSKDEVSPSISPRWYCRENNIELRESKKTNQSETAVRNYAL